MRRTRNCELYIDGASRGNPGPASVGAVLLDGHPKPIRQLSRYLGETTNNVAEYLALVYGLQEALQAGCQSLTVKTDSELLARQINGQYRVRDPLLQLLHGLAEHLLRGFSACRVEHIPREQNTAADRLAAQAFKRASVAP
jgi:ribonuclease HI